MIGARASSRCVQEEQNFKDRKCCGGMSSGRGVRVFVLTIQSAYPDSNPCMCLCAPCGGECARGTPRDNAPLCVPVCPTERQRRTYRKRDKHSRAQESAESEGGYSLSILGREEGEKERKRKRRRERARESKRCVESVQLPLLLLFCMGMAQSLFPFLSFSPTHEHG
jgi:hypothetical protein